MLARLLQADWIWLIALPSGRVVKLRFTLLSVLILSLTVMGLVGGIVYFYNLASRYERIELSIREIIQQNAEASPIKELKEGSVSPSLKLAKEYLDIKGSYEQLKKRLLILKLLLSASLGDDTSIATERNLNKGLKDKGGAEIECRDLYSCLPTPSDVKARLNSPDSYPPNMGVDDNKYNLYDIIQQLRRIPLGYPVKGWITSKFGLRRSPFTGRLTKHEGLDFSAPYRTPVTATADGVVKSVRRSKTYGLVVDVDHGNGYLTRYAHLLKTFVKRGQRVTRGKILALTGSSGASTGPHLHYEIRLHNKALDPERFMFLTNKLYTLVSSIE